MKLHGRFRQLIRRWDTARIESPSRQRAIQSAEDSYGRNLSRIRDRQGLPLEVLQSVQALENARRAYLEAVVGHNEAQFRLQWALGWPLDATPAKDPRSLTSDPARHKLVLGTDEPLALVRMGGHEPQLVVCVGATWRGCRLYFTSACGTLFEKYDLR